MVKSINDVMNEFVKDLKDKNYISVFETQQEILNELKEIGDNIKKYRKLKNLTQKELAEKAKISKPALVNYETGKRAPTLNALINISIILEIDINNLVPRLYNYCENSNNIYLSAVNNPQKTIETITNILDSHNIEYSINDDSNKFDIDKFYISITHDNKTIVLNFRELMRIYMDSIEIFENSIIKTIYTLTTFKE